MGGARGRLLRNSCSKRLTVTLSEQCAAAVTARHARVLTVQRAGSQTLCVRVVCASVRVCVCARARIFVYAAVKVVLHSYGLMGTPECLSSPPEWDTLGVCGSTKAQPCLRRGVSLWLWGWLVGKRGGAPHHPLTRIVDPLKPRTSPLHALPLPRSASPGGRNTPSVDRGTF